MSKVKLGSIIAMLSIVTVLSGCALTGGGETDRPADEVVREAFQNFSANVDTAVMDMDMTISVNPPAEMADEAVEIDLKISGAVDSTDPEKPRFSMLFDVAGEVPEMGPQSAKAELRMDGQVLYAMLSELSDFGGNVPAALVEPYMGQWWSMPIPEESMAGFATLSPADLAAQEEKINEILGRTDFFKDLEYVGSEKVSGVDTWHYRGVLNEDAVVSFLAEISTEFGDYTPTEEEMAELREGLEMMDFSGDVWVGQDDVTLRRISGDINVVVPEEEGDVKIMFDVTYSALNEPVTIDIPEDAIEFDPMSMMGGGMMAPDYAEYEDFDPAEFEDFDPEAFEAEMAEFEAEFAELEAEMAEFQ